MTTTTTTTIIIPHDDASSLLRHRRRIRFRHQQRQRQQVGWMYDSLLIVLISTSLIGMIMMMIMSTNMESSFLSVVAATESITTTLMTTTVIVPDMVEYDPNDHDRHDNNDELPPRPPPDGTTLEFVNNDYDNENDDDNDDDNDEHNNDDDEEYDSGGYDDDDDGGEEEEEYDDEQQQEPEQEPYDEEDNELTKEYQQQQEEDETEEDDVNNTNHHYHPITTMPNAYPPVPYHHISSSVLYPLTVDGNYDTDNGVADDDFASTMTMNQSSSSSFVVSSEDNEEEEKEEEIESSSSSSKRNSKGYDGCPLWVLDGWMLTGRSISRHDMVTWPMDHDVMIPWKQHSTRGFPLWGRDQYFVSIGFTQYLFAPAITRTFYCHERHHNVYYDNNTSNHTNAVDDYHTNYTWPPPYGSTHEEVTVHPILRANRAIGIGDPLFVPCSNGYHAIISVDQIAEDFPYGITNYSLLLQAGGKCYNPYDVVIRPSSIHGYGVFANTQVIPGNITLFMGRLIHIHRYELYDRTNKRYELLLNYCFGHPRTSLLLLPAMPFVNRINHHHEAPNIRVELLIPSDNDTLFDRRTEDMFLKSERSKFYIRYRTIRSIQPGEEIVLDYGPHYQKALTTWQMQGHDDDNNFRCEIGVPEHDDDDKKHRFFPETWLDNETAMMEEFPEWNTSKLLSNEIQPVSLTNIPKVKESILDRIGLPENLTTHIYQWAESLGIIELLQDYILHGTKTLPVDDEERLRMNGGTWWMKRFDQSWESNMHYLTPDDDISNQHFMNALYDAGFQTILQAIGNRYHHTSLTCYYASFIAVSHCTEAYMHSDSNFDGSYNLIFPILQVNVTTPELILGNTNDDTSQHFMSYIPYRYEYDHAVLLGRYGIHGTSPCDYRPIQQMRIVVSVYMGDFTNETLLQEIHDEWGDPPYPLYDVRKETLRSHQHWHRHHPNITLRTPYG